MSGSSPDQPWWKRHPKILLGYSVAGIVGSAATALGTILLAWWAGLWTWLLSNIQAHPLRIITATSSAATLVVLYVMLLWRRVARIALAKALRVDAAEREAKQWKSKCEAFEAEKFKTPKDPLQESERLVLNCLLCAEEASIAMIAKGMNWTGVDPATTIVRDLRYKHGFVARTRIRGTKEELFALTDAGKDYAKISGMIAVKQGGKSAVENADEIRIKELEAKVRMLDPVKPIYFPVSGSAGTTNPYLRPPLPPEPPPGL